MLKDDIPRVVAALEEQFPRVTRGWPSDFNKLPVIAVSEAGNAPADYRDDDIYIDELSTDVRVFAYTAEEIAECAAKVDSTMSALKYRRRLVYEEGSAEVRMKVMRFKKTG